MGDGCGRCANVVYVLEGRDAWVRMGVGKGHRSRERTRRTALYSVVRVLALLPPIRARQCTIYPSFRSVPFHPVFSFFPILHLCSPPPHPTPPHHAYATTTATTGSSTGSGCIVFASARKEGKRARQHNTLRSRRPKRVHRRCQRHVPAHHHAPREVLLLQLERRRVRLRPIGPGDGRRR